jgi:hypothetical protein
MGLDGYDIGEGIKMDKAIIHDLEGLYSAALRKIDELEEQCATAEDEIYTLIQDRMKLQAQAAAMREALEQAIISPSWEFQHVAKGDVMEILDTSDAGAALLERLAMAESKIAAFEFAQKELAAQVHLMTARAEKAEAERVEATSLESYCRDSGCIPYQKGAWMACEACDLCDIPRYYDYLRDHNMIREAE